MTLKPFAKKPIQLPVRLKPELHKYLKAAAKRHGISLNGEVVMRLQISRSNDEHSVPAKAGNRASRSEA